MIINEAPDDVTASAVILAEGSPGHVKATRTTRLLTVEEAMETTRKAGGAAYRVPG